MKQGLRKLARRIDALTLRERVLGFGTVVVVIVALLHYTVLDPLFGKQTVLRAQISKQQNNIAGIHNEIGTRLKAYALDPDAATRAALASITAETARLAGDLRAMQKGLVAPERIAPLVETILRSNGRLQLVSMKTLPVSGVTQAADAKEDGAVAGLLYRHGVQLAVRGNYLDMVNYLEALEAMPTQLFWARAELDVDEYPDARLTLTLYTLSLDRKWIKL